MKRFEQDSRGQNPAREHLNNCGHNSQQHEPAAVKRVVFRLGATVMRQARLTQEDTEQEEEERLVMDFSEEEEDVRRR